MGLTREGLTPPANTKNPGHFGPGIIGEEQFEREKEWVKIGAPVFGPAVIGDSPPQQPTAAQLRAQPELAKLHGLEPAKSDAVKDLDAQILSPVAAKAQLPIGKLKDALADNPYILDGMIAAEFERQEGPRKAALRILLAEEQQKAEPRADVVARLAGALKPAAA